MATCISLCSSLIKLHFRKKPRFIPNVAKVHSTLTNLSDGKGPGRKNVDLTICLKTQLRLTIKSLMKILNIPCEFSVAHLPNCKVKIVLQNMKGQCWTVNSVSTTRVHTSHTLCGGWIAFVRDNDIKLGDICVFELVRECEFRLHIQTGELFGSSCAGINLKDLSKKAKGNSPKVHTKSLRMIEMAESRKHGNTSKSTTKGDTFSQSVGTSKKLGKGTCRKHVEDGLQSKAELRMRLSLIEEKTAQSFSCFPSFVKIMKKFNVSGSFTLKIPYQFSTEHLPNWKTEIVLRNSKGESWTVNSVLDSKGRVVHKFCGGWIAFVRGNTVNIGDVCIF